MCQLADPNADSADSADTTSRFARNGSRRGAILFCARREKPLSALSALSATILNSFNYLTILRWSFLRAEEAFLGSLPDAEIKEAGFFKQIPRHPLSAS